MLRNTQVLELSKCRTKINGLNTALFTGASLCGTNIQIILRKQNPLTLFKECTCLKKLIL